MAVTKFPPLATTWSMKAKRISRSRASHSSGADATRRILPGPIILAGALRRCRPDARCRSIRSTAGPDRSERLAHAAEGELAFLDVPVRLYDDGFGKSGRAPCMERVWQ